MFCDGAYNNADTFNTWNIVFRKIEVIWPIYCLPQHMTCRVTNSPAYRVQTCIRLLSPLEHLGIFKEMSMCGWHVRQGYPGVIREYFWHNSFSVKVTPPESHTRSISEKIYQPTRVQFSCTWEFLGDGNSVLHATIKRVLLDTNDAHL